MLPILLPHRGLFALSLKPGATASPNIIIDFLEKIITADTAPLRHNQPIYSALLTATGKYLADFFIIPPSPGNIWGDGFLIEMDKPLMADFKLQLQKYILRQPIAITMVEEQVYVSFDKPIANPEHANMFFITDPRRQMKGEDDILTQPCYRIYGQVAAHGEEQTPYHRWRIENMLPEGAMDFTPQESMVVEYHLQNTGGLSLTKGCFVGQEVTARMFYKQATAHKLKKQLIQKTIDTDYTLAAPDKILSTVPLNNKKLALVIEKRHG